MASEFTHLNYPSTKDRFQPLFLENCFESESQKMIKVAQGFPVPRGQQLSL